MANQVVQVGRPVTSSTTGSVVNLIPASCKLLGFWANASTTLSVYDSASTTVGTAVVVASACAVGWNPLPLDLNAGLSVNQGAQLYFSIQA